MDLCNINEIKALLARHGFRFSKSMGQNWDLRRAMRPLLLARSTKRAIVRI